MTKLFKKSKKKLYWGPFWSLFAKIWAKMNFLGKKGLSQFLDIAITTHLAKNQKKLMSHS